MKMTTTKMVLIATALSMQLFMSSCSDSKRTENKSNSGEMSSAVSSESSSSKAEEVANTEEEVTSSAMEVSPKQLYADYQDNEVAADLKYKDKTLEVKGVIDDIGKDIMDEIYITLKTGEMFGNIQCTFDDSHVKEAAALKKGQHVTVRGNCDGKFMNVLMSDCTLK